MPVEPCRTMMQSALSMLHGLEQDISPVGVMMIRSLLDGVDAWPQSE
jgi:hypothetical protein